MYTPLQFLCLHPYTRTSLDTENEKNPHIEFPSLKKWFNNLYIDQGKLSLNYCCVGIST